MVAGPVPPGAPTRSRATHSPRLDSVPAVASPHHFVPENPTRRGGVAAHRRQRREPVEATLSVWTTKDVAMCWRAFSSPTHWPRAAGRPALAARLRHRASAAQIGRSIPVTGLDSSHASLRWIVAMNPTVTPGVERFWIERLFRRHPTSAAPSWRDDLAGRNLRA